MCPLARRATFVRLTLRTVDGVTSGAISLGDIELGKDGTVVKAADAPKAMTTISSAQTDSADKVEVGPPSRSAGWADALRWAPALWACQP
jgi:hypothetical protein